MLFYENPALKQLKKELMRPAKNREAISNLGYCNKKYNSKPKKRSNNEKSSRT